MFVSIVAALYILMGVAAIIVGATMLNGLGAIPGIIALVIGIGLWQGRKIFWYLGLISGIVYLMLSIFALPPPVGIVPMIVAIITLWYLVRPNVRRFFGIGS